MKAAPLTNHDHRKLLDLVRRDISETQVRLGMVRSSPPPLVEMEQKLANWVRARGNGQRVQVRAPRHQQLEISFHGAIPSPLGPCQAVPPMP